jgi:DNA-binding LytR/AlgR family response regulator
LSLINELYRYLKIVPTIIITTKKSDLAFKALQYQVTDSILKPLMHIDFEKLVFKLNKLNNETEIRYLKPISRF